MEDEKLLQALRDKLSQTHLPSLDAESDAQLPDILMYLATHDVIEIEALKKQFHLSIYDVKRIVQLLLNLWYLDVAAPDGKDQLLSNLSVADLNRIVDYGIKPLLELDELDGLDVGDDPLLQQVVQPAFNHQDIADDGVDLNQYSDGDSPFDQGLAGALSNNDPFDPGILSAAQALLSADGNNALDQLLPSEAVTPNESKATPDFTLVSDDDDNQKQLQAVHDHVNQLIQQHDPDSTALPAQSALPVVKGDQAHGLTLANQSDAVAADDDRHPHLTKAQFIDEYLVIESRFDAHQLVEFGDDDQLRHQLRYDLSGNDHYDQNFAIKQLDYQTLLSVINALYQQYRLNW